jgi:DNA-binding NtrC family response regulator
MSMAFLSEPERRVAEAVAALSDENPFLPRRIELERAALGDAFERTAGVWRAEASLGRLNPNLPKLITLAGRLAPELRARLARGGAPGERDLVLYEALVRYWLFVRYEDDLLALIRAGERGEPTTRRVPAYERFERDVREMLSPPGVRLPVAVDPPRLFAWGYQIRRAFHHTFRRIYGGSMPAARLRAAVWQSIFTDDVRRYRRALSEHMDDIPTLVVGESGTGKELVARAIALSGYIPFDGSTHSFAEDYAALFHPLNIAALSPTLVESELFGHRRGAFTGAVAAREGWLESCGARATVFLDEIGELDAAIQIKLLRVLETRGFQRIGETRARRFSGKIVAATNRDLALEMQAGRFRSDFYYRLCADVIRTPTLREQLGEAPGDLHELVLVIARRVVGEEEAPALAREMAEWIERRLGLDYPWPGNVRELEQCVRSFVIRHEYVPQRAAGRGADATLAEAVARGELTAEELLGRYCELIYAREGSYEATARRLGLDRRTVKAKLDARRGASAQ